MHESNIYRSGKVRNRLCRALLFFTLLWLIGIGTDSKGLQASEGSLTASVDSTADGPHLFLRDDSTAVVFYLCQDRVDSVVISTPDTIRFSGLCHDSLVDYVIPLSPPAVEPYEFTDVSKILAVSDIHGEYEHFVNILKSSEVIDAGNNWTFGDGHLVIVGDVFDRGAQVTECLWLLYRLELQARPFGGRVHFLLGNHELMILRGDNRYVHERYLKGIVRTTRIRHEDLYGPDMVLGRWLRSKHVVLKLNDILFLHGGISPFLVDRELSLDVINYAARKGLDLSSAEVAFSSLPKFLFGGKGPFWYRGYHYEMEGRYPRATDAEIENILTYYDLEAVVVGHTEHDSVSGMYDNRIFAIDVAVEELNGLQALLWMNGQYYKVSADGSKYLLR